MSVVINGSAGVTVNSGAVLGITSGTAVASTSGTSIDFTSIPSWVKRITVMFNGISTNGTSDLVVQLGSGSVETTGYISCCGYSASFSTSTSAFIAAIGVGASDILSGSVTITKLNGNSWTQTGIVSSNVPRSSSGSKTTSGTLDRVRITTAGGTNTFDAGSVNILYE
jgi:hypothetical protein